MPASGNRRGIGFGAETVADAGLRDPEATVAIVERIERDPATGKVRRFVPLA